MAAAMVTGCVALMFSVDSNLTVKQIRDCLEAGCASNAYTGALPNNDSGAGRLDVAKTLDEVKRLLTVSMSSITVGSRPPSNVQTA